MNSLKDEQKSFDQELLELQSLKDELEQAKNEEEQEKVRTCKLEEKVRDLSKHIQEENKKVKQLEDNVFSQKLNQIVYNHSRQNTILQITANN